MADFQQKKRIRSIVYSPLVVSIVVIIALYFIYSTWAVYRKMSTSRTDVTMAQNNLLELQKQNTQIDAETSELQTQAGVEKEIRAKFGVAKPDERLAVIVNDSMEASSSTEVHQGFWQKIKHFFGF